jgi:hypothetical protein
MSETMFKSNCLLVFAGGSFTLPVMSDFWAWEIGIHRGGGLIGMNTTGSQLPIKHNGKEVTSPEEVSSLSFSLQIVLEPSWRFLQIGRTDTVDKD